MFLAMMAADRGHVEELKKELARRDTTAAR